MRYKASKIAESSMTRHGSKHDSFEPIHRAQWNAAVSYCSEKKLPRLTELDRTQAGDRRKQGSGPLLKFN